LIASGITVFCLWALILSNVNCEAVRNNSEGVRITGEAGRNNPEGIRIRCKAALSLFDFYVQRTTYNQQRVLSPRSGSRRSIS